jgi:hypothetical protein
MLQARDGLPHLGHSTAGDAPGCTVLIVQDRDGSKALPNAYERISLPGRSENAMAGTACAELVETTPTCITRGEH